MSTISGITKEELLEVNGTVETYRESFSDLVKRNAKIKEEFAGLSTSEVVDRVCKLLGRLELKENTSGK